MNTRYGHSLIARAIAGLSLSASVIGSADSAYAATCNIPFPSTGAPCASGAQFAVVTHTLDPDGVLFRLSIDWRGGSLGAAAWGIDVNGNQNNRCGFAAADDDVRPQFTSQVDCMALFNTPGRALPSVSYKHPVNMQSTFVAVN